MESDRQLEKPRKPSMKLCWCAATDPALSGFSVARSIEQAGRVHAAALGPGKHGVRPSFVCEVPADDAERLGPPSDQLLVACGGEITPLPEGGARVKIAGKTYDWLMWRPGGFKKGLRPSLR
jgi:hypothetical protein